MKKQSTFITFSTQKGGVGKTTFTTLLAGILHYRLGYNVLVLDCDYPQHSLSQLRERDQKNVLQHEHYKLRFYRQFQAIQRKAYPVLRCKAEEALQQATDFISASPEPVDFVLFDLPSTVNTPGVLRTLAGMHYIFAPMTADRVVVESTLTFTDVLSKIRQKTQRTSIRSIQLFWNQVDGREKSALYRHYECIIARLGLQLMDSYVSDSKRFRKEYEEERKAVFRSTLLPPDERLLKGCGMDSFLEEFLQIIKTGNHEKTNG